MDTAALNGRNKRVVRPVIFLTLICIRGIFLNAYFLLERESAVQRKKEGSLLTNRNIFSYARNAPKQ
jgi:hypothetical protein